MLISSRWLKEWLPDADAARFEVTALERALTSLGLEVEGFTSYGQGFAKDVVVGEIVSVDKHPDADRLNVVQLRDRSGDGDEAGAIRQVVCGASNLPPPGGKVAFARVGALLPGDFKIGARKVRGVHSEGMICSASELDIGSDDEGIIILPSAWSPGVPLAEYLPEILDDVFEISVTPNRPDALGHLGVARDLSVLWKCKLHFPDVTASQDVALPRLEDLVTLQSPNRCGRYFGAALEGLTVSASPLSVQVRLHRVGLRSINSAVDVSNYVMMEYGQPLHVFDRQKLRGERVVIRLAEKGEALTTLDDSAIECRNEDLVIADVERAQALAGVMGGADSMVAADSTSALLEAAYFDPSPVRASARHFGFHTDSSHRFERGVDYGVGLQGAFERALYLLGSWCGAKIVGVQCVDGNLPSPAKIQFRPSRVERLLGMPISADFCQSGLSRLGIQIDGAVNGEAAWRCVAPSWRPDLQREVDLIEEVMRLHGLEDLPEQHVLPSDFNAPHPKPPLCELADRMIRKLGAAGYHEVVALVFRPDEDFELPALQNKLPAAEAPVQLKNPMRVQSSRLRQSLLPGLLEAVKLNVARHARPLRLFEVGRVYRWPRLEEAETAQRIGDPGSRDAALPEERYVAAWTALTQHRPLQGAAHAQRDASVQVLVRESLRFLRGMGLAPELLPFEAEDGELYPFLHPGLAAKIAVRKDPDASPAIIGCLGQVHPDLLRHYDLELADRCAYAEIELARLLPFGATPKASPLPRFPASSRDLSLLISEELSVDRIRETAQRIADSLPAPPANGKASPGSNEDRVRLAGGDASSRSVDLVEVYHGQELEAGQRSVLLRFNYRCEARSVTDEEVQTLHDALVQGLCQRLQDQGHPISVR